MSDNDKLLSMLKEAGEDPDPQTRKEMEQVWERASMNDPAETVDISEQEVNEALQKVKAQMGSGTRKRSAKPRGSFFKYAAAAVFLLATVGLAYILTPVTVNVPHGQTQTLTMPDQSTVKLNSGSQISYSRLFGVWNREVSLQGEGFFDVHSDNTPFIVTTGNAAIEVLGTKFNVRYWPSDAGNRTSVFLMEGVVSFASLFEGSDPVTLSTGQQSWVSDSLQQPTEPVKADEQRVLAWQHDSMAFENQPLSAIFAELQRRFDITINGHPEIMSETITIYLSDIEEAEAAIKDICRAKGLTYKKQNGKFLIYRD